jgi:hypothetical protein
MQDNMADLMGDAESLSFPTRAGVNSYYDPLPVAQSESRLGAIETITHNQRTFALCDVLDWHRGLFYPVLS